ncbi:MAG TPA: hydroxyphenylacetyl-CoA thioesterase PaaI [Alphaproteobacteria bacterium]|nr:hydroxyphenylacetyl-CoA thioesterase PaaI [Alphaproteobacteria bacterium]
MSEAAAHPMDGQVIAEAVAEALGARDRASRHVGIEIEAVGDGTAAASMVVHENLLNGLEVVHGGYIFTLADTAMAYASNSCNQPALAQTCQVTFLAPGRAGDRLTATAREAGKAGRTGIYDVEVRNQDGLMIALFRGQTRTISGRIVEG